MPQMMSYGAYVFPLIMVVVTLAWVLMNRQRLKTAQAENADKNVGSMAARLGMTLVEGDPNLNLLYFQQPSGDFQRRIQMQGQPYGRAYTFTLTDGQKTSEFIVARKITHTFGCFLEAQLEVQCPAFEVVLRDPNQYLIADQQFAERGDLAPVSTGNPTLDQHFVVRATDPRVAPALASALSLLSTHLFVHLAGEGNRVWMSFSRIGLPYLSAAPEEYLLALETAACGVTGKPAPAALNTAPAAVAFTP